MPHNDDRLSVDISITSKKQGGETFGEASGTQRPTGSEPRPAQLLRPKLACLPVDHSGLNGAPNCSSNHPNLPHIGFDGSRTNGIAVAAQNAPA